MRKSVLTKLTYANVAATAALFLALSGGVAYAANTVGSSDIIDESILSADIQNGAVANADLATNSVTGGKVVDGSLSNQDVGVLFAEVNANATLANSSGGVTVTRVNAVGVGNYSVRFGRDVHSCAAVATIGGAGTTPSSGQVNLADRAGNVNSVFVDTNDAAGKAADRPFRLVVVC